VGRQGRADRNVADGNDAPAVRAGEAGPVVSVENLRKLLRACDGREFLDLCDAALIRLMLEPGGMRRAEAIGLTIDSVDLDSDVVVVMGKGRRPRAVPYGHKTGQALTRYLRARSRHPYAQRTDALWLAQKGLAAIVLRKYKNFPKDFHRRALSGRALEGRASGRF
jgi:site-specific recombinase XerC